MFKSKQNRFLTRAISESLHVEIQGLLWSLIDRQNEKGNELDYLQIFELKIQDGKQQIIHRQEIPEKEDLITITLHYTKPVHTTVWCIDSGDYQTMLYPEDY